MGKSSMVWAPANLPLSVSNLLFQHLPAHAFALQLRVHFSILQGEGAERFASSPALKAS